jgi:hypothetical protein
VNQGHDTLSDEERLKRALAIPERYYSLGQVEFHKWVFQDVAAYDHVQVDRNKCGLLCQGARQERVSGKTVLGHNHLTVLFI